MSIPGDKSTPLERREQAIAAATRALAGRGDLEVVFRGGAQERANGRMVRLPPLRSDGDPLELARIRGEADGAALRLRWHDPKVHERFAPTGELAALLFDRLEQVRVEVVGSRHLEGVRQNLAEAYRARFSARRGGEGVDTTIADVVDLYLRERLAGYELSQAERELMGGWRAWLDERIGAEVPELAQKLDDQADFARKVREMLVTLGLSDEAVEPERGEEDEEERAENGQGQANTAEAGQSEAGESHDDVSKPRPPKNLRPATAKRKPRCRARRRPAHRPQPSLGKARRRIPGGRTGRVGRRRPVIGFSPPPSTRW